MSMRASPHRLLAALVVLALLGAGVALAVAPDPDKHATAYFNRASGIHPGDEVRILGVRVGTVDEVQPEGTRVRVRFSYDAARKVPANAQVALVAPSLVSGRYLQLAPVYRGGPELPPGALIPDERTAEPVEWDQVSSQLTELAKALGPQGANKDGTVSRLLGTAEANLAGNGKDFATMLRELSSASATVAGGSEDLFATLRNLNDFVTALNTSRDKLTSFSTQLAEISDLAASNRAQLDGALRGSNQALRTATGFVREHKEGLGGTVRELAEVASTLAGSRDKLANVLHTAPQTMANLYNIYEPSTGSASTRLMLPYTSSMSTFACQAIFSVGGTIDDCRGALNPLLSLLDVPHPPVGVDPLSRPGASNQRPPGGEGQRGGGR